jgi:hypothetical protein
MQGQDQTRLVLELRSVTEPIEGRMCTEEGRSHDFVGWLGLATALRGVLGEAAPAADREGRRSRPDA